MSLTKGSGTWSTLARWCGKKRPHLIRAAATTRIHDWPGGSRASAGAGGKCLFTPDSTIKKRGRGPPSG